MLVEPGETLIEVKGRSVIVQKRKKPTAKNHYPSATLDELIYFCGVPWSKEEADSFYTTFGKINVGCGEVSYRMHMQWPHSNIGSPGPDFAPHENSDAKDAHNIRFGSDAMKHWSNIKTRTLLEIAH